MNNIKNCEKILKLFYNENRLRISFMLLNRPLCVREINEILDITLSTFSTY